MTEDIKINFNGEMGVLITSLFLSRKARSRRQSSERFEGKGVRSAHAVAMSKRKARSPFQRDVGRSPSGATLE